MSHASLLDTVALSLSKNKLVFDILPVPAAVLNKDLEFVYANKSFKRTFGPWEGRKSWEVYHKDLNPGKQRNCVRVFERNTPVISQGDGVARSGQMLHYTKYSMPLNTVETQDAAILEICIDNTSVDILRHEYQSLFDLVPCNVVVIDTELRIIDSNQAVRDIYGNLEGKSCFAMLKGLKTPCSDCIAKKAFSSKSPQQDHHVWQHPNGELRDYQVTAVPIEDEKGKVRAIMEMAVDITELTRLRDESDLKNLMFANVVSNALRGLAVVADDGTIPIQNQALTKILGLPAIGVADGQDLFDLLPDKVMKAIESGVDSFLFSEVLLFPERGDEAVPVNLQGSRLKVGSKSLGLLLAFYDLREIKNLEKAKMEAERMAAVGQTVSGLAHGVKNLVTALEGGMYMLNSGMQAGKVDRIAQGMDMLRRNIERIGGFVKSFLSFARGREMKVSPGDPAAVVGEVVDLYRVKASQHCIDLRLNAQPGVAPAAIDYEGLHEGLTNLVGNAIDSCLMSEQSRRFHIDVNFFEKDDVLIYEVIDNGCGMDAETRKRVFTSFFTTKGENGTGLGLLMTKKLVQQHGGSIELESDLEQGATFRIRLPRASLPKPTENGEQAV